MLAYLIPRHKLLVAVVAVVMRQLVTVELLVGKDEVTFVTLNFDFVQDCPLNSVHRQEAADSLCALFVGTHASIRANQLVLSKAAPTEGLFAFLTQPPVPNEIVADVAVDQIL